MAIGSWPPDERPERAMRLHADHSIAGRDSTALEVIGDERTGAPVLFDETDVHRSAADRLDNRRASPGIRIHDPGAEDRRRQDIEKRFAQLVRRRPESHPGWRRQAPT